MAKETKVIRGGFRATLALIISIIALVLAVMAFDRSGARSDLDPQVKELQSKIERLKRETSEQIDKARQETASALKKLSEALKKESGEP